MVFLAEVLEPLLGEAAGAEALGAEEVEVGSVGDLEKAWHQELEARKAAMIHELQQLATEATQYMQQNAPWRDVTGTARKSLYCKITVNSSNGPGSTGLYFDIDVDFGYDDSCDYGEFLETDNGGAFAIVGPATSYYAPRIEAIVGKYFGDG
jgi:hypothetical protein